MQVAADELSLNKNNTNNNSISSSLSHSASPSLSSSDITSIRHGVSNTNVIISRKQHQNHQKRHKIPSQNNKNNSSETEDTLENLLPKKSFCRKNHLKFQKNCCHCKRKRTMQRQLATSVEDSGNYENEVEMETENSENNSEIGRIISEKPKISRQTSCIQFGLRNNHDNNANNDFSIFNSNSSLATGKNSRTISLDALSMLDKLTGSKITTNISLKKLNFISEIF